MVLQTPKTAVLNSIVEGTTPILQPCLSPLHITIIRLVGAMRCTKIAPYEPATITLRKVVTIDNTLRRSRPVRES